MGKGLKHGQELGDNKRFRQCGVYFLLSQVMNKRINKGREDDDEDKIPVII